MSTFAWMFVEQLHIYRMLTEVRNINFGHMRFYYVVGWGIPAIITGTTLNHPKTASFPFPAIFTGQIQESYLIQDSYGCTRLLLSLQCFPEWGQHQIMSSRSQPVFGRTVYQMSVAPVVEVIWRVYNNINTTAPRLKQDLITLLGNNSIFILTTSLVAFINFLSLCWYLGIWTHGLLGR